MHSDDGENEQKIPRKKHIPINLLLSEGNKFLQLSQFDKAISWYQKILQHNPNHIQALLGKAKCYMKLGNYKEALTDFDQVLNINPKCAVAINLKGIAEHLMGNFEKSFATFWRGYQLQPFCDYLRLGYRFSRKAIENSLNAEERMLLTENDMKKLNNLKLKNNVDSCTGYDKKGLYSTDLKLLENIRKDKTLNTLHSSCAELSDYLIGRQKFWKMQEPYKTVGKKSNSSIFVKNEPRDSAQMSKLVRSFALCKLALNERKTALCITKSHEALELLHSLSEDFREKNEIEAGILHCLVMAYLIEEDFETSMKYCSQLLCTANEKDMPKLKGGILRDFGEIFYKSRKYQEALEFFLESLEFSENEEEKSAVLYKISDCNIHLNNLTDAKDAAEKCLDIVVRRKNLRFHFDALLLLAEIAVMGREMKLAEEHYRNALEIAVQNNDTRKESLEHLLQSFEEVFSKDSYSKERIKIIKITDNMKLT